MSDQIQGREPRDLHLLDEPQEVAPPEVVGADHGVFVPVLVLPGLLVVAEVEQRRVVEDVDHFRDQVGADAVVDVGRNHPVVVAEPEIVGGGEVELGHEVDAERGQPRLLGLHLGRGPGPLDGDFGVGFVPDAIAEAEDHLVHPGVDHLGDEVVPVFVVPPEERFAGEFRVGTISSRPSASSE